MNFVAPWLYAASSAVLSAIVFGFVFRGLTPPLAALSLALGAATAAFGFWQNRRARFVWRCLNGWEWGVFILFALFALRAFLWVVFFAGDEIRVLSPNNLGDLALHLTYIREVVNGEGFWPDNPIYAGTKLSYPIGVDLLHSLLVLEGADVFRTFVWLGLAGSLLTGIALFRWGGAFTITGFLCNGGLAGAAFFLTGVFADYQKDLGWKSIPLALFVTQRGFLFALPAGLLLLSSWRARFFPAKSGAKAPAEQPLPRWGEWLLYSSLPVFHFHTFLFLSLLLAWWFCFERHTSREIFGLVLRAVVPATVLVLLITSFFHGPKVLGLAPGWMQDAPEYLALCRTYLLPHSADTDAMGDALPIVGTGAVWITRPVFWIVNFGFLPIFITLLVRAVWKDERAARDRAFLYPALAIFGLCLFIKFAPWEWDNTKLMIWSYLLWLPLLWQRVIRPWPLSVQALACVALFGSGFVCLIGGLAPPAAPAGSPVGTHVDQGSAIANRSELDAVERDLRGISPRERFVARPNYNHPLLLLGRKVVAGYTGHLWSHGYQGWDATVANVNSIMNGGNGWREIAKGFDARYLFWGSQEAEAYPDSTQPWRTGTRAVATGDWGTVYDLESLPTD